MGMRKWLVTPANGSLLLLVGLLLSADIAVRHVGAQQGGEPPKLIQAQEFRLVDQNGKTKANLAGDADGNPILSLFDKDGKRRGIFRTRTNGTATLSLHDPDGKSRVEMDTQEDGSASISLTNRAGKGGYAAVVLPDGKAILTLTNRDGKAVWAEPDSDLAHEPSDPPIKK